MKFQTQTPSTCISGYKIIHKKAKQTFETKQSVYEFVYKQTYVNKCNIFQ